MKLSLWFNSIDITLMTFYINKSSIYLIHDNGTTTSTRIGDSEIHL